MKKTVLAVTALAVMFCAGCGGKASNGRPAAATTADVTPTAAALTSVAPASGASSSPDSIDMAFVDGGTFLMGCNAEQDDYCENDEKPAHRVTVTGFYMSKYEVTQGLWKAVMGENPSNFTWDDNLPVETVSWNDAQEFIRKLNAKTGKNYRLPTEAEWEYAARGGNKSKGYLYSGSNIIGDVAWYGADSVFWDDALEGTSYGGNSNGGTRLVGRKAPNELGIYDMSGNVAEWVNDWYGYYDSSSQTDPTGPSTGCSDCLSGDGMTTSTNTDHVIRGGGWYLLVRFCRVSVRDLYPTRILDNVGFRLAHD